MERIALQLALAGGSSVAPPKRYSRGSNPLEGTMYLPYAGIGSRQVPKAIAIKQSTLATTLADRGFTLRSGGASGSDDNFERGAPPHLSEIYVPWNGFNGRFTSAGSHIITPDMISEEASMIAHELVDVFHPNPSALLPNSGRRMMQRNGHQVLGKTMQSPVLFVVCYATGTERKMVDGKYRIVNVAGGTGQAVRIAAHLEIPVFNLIQPSSVTDLMEYLDQLGWATS